MSYYICIQGLTSGLLGSAAATFSILGTNLIEQHVQNVIECNESCVTSTLASVCTIGATAGICWALKKASERLDPEDGFSGFKRAASANLVFSMLGLFLSDNKNNLPLIAIVGTPIGMHFGAVDKLFRNTLRGI